ncbi:MAG: 1-acyl-sn-glycerol-3-phosphate acyltransferase, partial [Pseudomonadota bacterium]
MSSFVDKYADIRPYNDDEVPAALSRLLEDNDFIDVIAKHNAPSWLNKWPFIARPLVRS